MAGEACGESCAPSSVPRILRSIAKHMTHGACWAHVRSACKRDAPMQYCTIVKVLLCIVIDSIIGARMSSCVVWNLPMK